MTLIPSHSCDTEYLKISLPQNHNPSFSPEAAFALQPGASLARGHDAAASSPRAPRKPAKWRRHWAANEVSAGAARRTKLRALQRRLSLELDYYAIGKIRAGTRAKCTEANCP